MRRPAARQVQPSPAVTVLGARGGAGATVVAALLARAIPGAILCDFDFTSAGQLAFADEDAGTGFDRVAAVPTPDVVTDACERHAAGRALLVRPRASSPHDSVLSPVVEAVRRAASALVIDSGQRPVSGSSATVLVCADDLASLRFARRYFDTGAEAHVLLNRLRRRGLRASHFHTALGREPVAVLPPDRRLARAADLGVLPKRVPRAITRLAQMVTA